MVRAMSQKQEEIALDLHKNDVPRESLTSKVASVITVILLFAGLLAVIFAEDLPNKFTLGSAAFSVAGVFQVMRRPKKDVSDWAFALGGLALLGLSIAAGALKLLG